MIKLNALLRQGVFLYMACLTNVHMHTILVIEHMHITKFLNYITGRRSIIARNSICRRVCMLPENTTFTPDKDIDGYVTLTIDAIEALRLCDLEELDQAQAADMMGVSRGTLQRILYQAHRTTAEALIAGKGIHIAGGNYSVNKCACPNIGQCHRCNFADQKKNEQLSTKIKLNVEGTIMKIAITTEGNQVFQHFGSCPLFTLIEIENNTVINRKSIDASDSGHAALAGFLQSNEVDLLICGGIGGGARNALAEADIALISGCKGDIDVAITEYLAGTLKDKPEGMCNHHHEGANHQCGAGEQHCH
jgi:predicted DNA-binding protein (UPF0251 family)/predicted Fe-Mo cluster-binding NifX family protein